jgi:hypothetical protein
VLPATQMLPIIQSGVQLRINGNHKFKEKNFKSALTMYMQGCVGFEMYCATNDQDQKLLDEVHIQVRKNTAGAALKTRDYTLCIYSCDKVLDMQPGDTKSHYRRALANWRLGEIEKASTDLEAILKVRAHRLARPRRPPRARGARGNPQAACQSHAPGGAGARSAAERDPRLAPRPHPARADSRPAAWPCRRA